MTNQNTQLPAEGIYFNMPAQEYFDLPYFSRSAAQIVRFSGKQFEYSLKNSKFKKLLFE